MGNTALTNVVFTATFLTSQSFSAGSFVVNLGNAQIKQRPEFAKLFQGGIALGGVGKYDLQLDLQISPNPFPPPETFVSVALLLDEPLTLFTGSVSNTSSPTSVFTNRSFQINSSKTSKLRLSTLFAGTINAGSKLTLSFG